MLIHQLLDVPLPQRLRDAIDAHLETRPKTLRLQSILCSKLARSLGDCPNASAIGRGVRMRGRVGLLSSCRLSINACFCACVIPAARCEGFCSGVLASSSVVDGAGGAGKDGIASLGETEAFCLAFRGGMFGCTTTDALQYECVIRLKGGVLVHL